jgi:hypothetical protein
MFVNVIKSYRDIVAVCDSELLGKKFEEPFEKGIKQLDVKESFYKGKEGKKVSKEELLDIIKSFSREDSTFNIVGKKSIQAALEAGTISEKEVGRVQEIPFALVLL